MQVSIESFFCPVHALKLIPIPFGYASFLDEDVNGFHTVDDFNDFAEPKVGPFWARLPTDGCVSVVTYIFLTVDGK